MRRRRNDRSGETLVEVMVSIFLFLIMLAVLQGSVAFCTNAQRKNEQIREKTAELERAFYETPGSTKTGENTYTFKASSADGSMQGEQTLFRVNVELREKQVSSDTTFYLFGTGGQP